MYIYVACYVRNIANRELTLSTCPLKLMLILIIDLQLATSGQYMYIWALGRCLVGYFTHRCWLSLFVLLYYWLFQISYLEQ